MRLFLSAAGCAAFTGLLSSTSALAAEPLSQGLLVYAGGTLGAVAIQHDDYKIDSKNGSDGRASGGAFVGLRLVTLPVSDGWPLYMELAYQDIARHTLRYKVQSTTSDVTASGYAVSLAGRLSMPLATRFGLYGKVGVAYAKVSGSTPAGQAAVGVEGTGTGLLHAFGAEYQFDSGPILRGELAGYSKTSDKSSAGAFTLGLGFRF